MTRRVWLKFLLALLLGFWFGLALGFMSSFLMYYYLPDQWLENGFKDRKVRHERFIEHRRCRVSLTATVGACRVLTTSNSGPDSWSRLMRRATPSRSAPVGQTVSALLLALRLRARGCS